ncbi:class I SAM-dependent methyltransferase [uncultured Microbacterium sp.]|uniref:class I SAM-dependent methyltransferase n=1 Tax=uncultured Microbacterium sp. TaxID=191216 RepID=UPI001DB9D116|nr:hypothetical protein [uncultured Microbacterium sp.]MBS1898121.1 hypothetical protein [Actinomycetota bacterium]
MISMDPGRSGFGVSSRAGRVAGAVGRRSGTSALLAVLMALFLVGGSALGSQAWALHAALVLAAFAAAGLLRSFWYTKGPGGVLLWARLIGGVRLQHDARILTVGATPEHVGLMLASRFPTATTTIGGTTSFAGGCRLPYRDGQFQLVTLQLSSIPDRAREELLREAARVLARGGSLIVLDYGRASRDEVLLRACGLRVRRVRPGPRGRPGGLLVPPAAVVAAG